MSYRNHYDGAYNPYVDHQQTQQRGNGNGNGHGNNNNNTTYQNNPYIDNQFNQMVQNFGPNANQSYLNQHGIPKRDGSQHNEYNDYNHNNYNHNNNYNNNYRGGRGRGYRGRGRGKRYSKPNVPPRHRGNHYYEQPQEENPYITHGKDMAQIKKEIREEGVHSGNTPPSPPSQSSGGGEIKENIDPVPDNISTSTTATTTTQSQSTISNTNTNTTQDDDEVIDFAALVAGIALDWDKKQKDREEYERRKKENKDFAALVAGIALDWDKKQKDREEYERRKKEEQERKEREKAERLAARRAAKYKNQHQNHFDPSLGGINENDEENYGNTYGYGYGYNEENYEDTYNQDLDGNEDAYTQFLVESGQPLQETGITSPNCADIDEIDENGAAVGLIQEGDMEDGMEKITPGNIYKLKVKDTLMIMNEEDNTLEYWNLDDIDTLYLELKNGGNRKMTVWSEDLKNLKLYRTRSDVIDENETDDSKQDGGDASGFRKDFDYSTHVIKDEAGQLW
eukprot:CAMPEP_0201593596 /NCGR_PEP_ID=MMETSP0190_2-20130828/191151_1 /ASSEMBLY_ACC=CAM_ASM_000263 /TAXON_ID=37353 /ORGANISM="Rosalina sp." /LENGTH=508 /DNA_ID=CAMNT_0048052845 /DNA_START=75 /DNA_END=1598 /DNA_ORIENTATION=-